MSASSRRAYHHGNLAEALSDVALRLVRARGAAGFSLREAAREVGVDVAAVYRHYADKDALLRAVARAGFDLMGARMDVELAGATGGAARLRAVGRGYVAFAVAEPELFRLMFGPLGAGGAHGGPPRETSTPYTRLLDALDLLSAEGAVAVPVGVAADAAWSIVHGFSVLVVDGPFGDGPVGERLAPVIDVLVAGLAPPRDAEAP